MARERKDPLVQVHRLERRHVELSARVAELEKHLFLTPQEQVFLSLLKKEKLAAKDALADLRRAIPELTHVTSA